MNEEINAYQTIFESLSEGLILLDEKKKLSQANESAARILGKGVQELIGKSLWAVLPSLDKDFFPKTLGQVSALCPLTTNGEEIILAVTSTPLGEVYPCKHVLVLRDVTAAQAGRQLQTYFLANITHEFRTPLSALKASVELILESLGEVSQSELERLLRSIHYSVAGLQTLIDNLLESANIESGHFHIYPQDARLGEVIGNAARVMSPLLKRRDQGLQIEMDWSMPPMSFDPTRITQVIVNLLSNASKYSPIGKGIRIRVSSEADGHLRVSVIDQGAGLSLRERENLFKKFVRLNDTKEQFGVGLGLSVVKAIVEAHGGTVGVDENPQGGSIFWFTLPMKTVKVSL